MSNNAQVCKKTLEPVWEQAMSFKLREGGPEHLDITLFDEDKIGKVIFSMRFIKMSSWVTSGWM